MIGERVRYAVGPTGVAVSIFEGKLLGGDVTANRVFRVKVTNDGNAAITVTPMVQTAAQRAANLAAHLPEGDVSGANASVAGVTSDLTGGDTAFTPVLIAPGSEKDLEFMVLTATDIVAVGVRGLVATTEKESATRVFPTDGYASRVIQASGEVRFMAVGHREPFGVNA